MTYAPLPLPRPAVAARAVSTAALVALGLAAGAGCSKDEAQPTTTTTTSAGGSAPQPLCTTPTDPECQEQVTLELKLQPTVAPGLTSDTPDGDGFVTEVDATAGGFNATVPDAYVYARFTPTGLEKVAISDDDSLASMDWDIAFRRYMIRVNSGNSGPSCVAVARVPGTADFASVTTLPDNLVFHEDEYFTAAPNCTIIPDGSGLGSAATALSTYWSYPGCVKMQGYVYVVALADGRHVKLTVTRYYDTEQNQQTCQTTDAVPMSATGGHIQIRWAFLP